MKALKTLLFIVVSTLIFNSCKENTTPISSDDFDFADDEVVAEALFDDVYSSADDVVQLFDEYVLNGTPKGDDIVVLKDSCPIVTVSMSDDLVKTITIDYGDGCAGFNDKVRSGKIIVEVTAPRRAVGSARTVTFDNFFFNGIKMEGTKTIENMGPNDSGNVVFLSSLSDGRLIFPNDTVVERSFTRYREYIAGYSTKYVWDDECMVTGDVTGKNYNGINYNNTITTALHWKRACKFFVSGVIQIERDGIEPFELDYGDGECDAKAVIRRGEEEKEIMLRMFHRKLRQ